MCVSRSMGAAILGIEITLGLDHYTVRPSERPS
jgi:hypothetical protein